MLGKENGSRVGFKDISQRPFPAAAGIMICQLPGWPLASVTVNTKAATA